MPPGGRTLKLVPGNLSPSGNEQETDLVLAVDEPGYHADTDPRQPERLSDRCAFLQRFAQGRVTWQIPLSPILPEHIIPVRSG